MPHLPRSPSLQDTWKRSWAATHPNDLTMTRQASTRSPRARFRMTWDMYFHERDGRHDAHRRIFIWSTLVLVSSHCTMPIDGSGQLFSGIDTGMCLPRWHCAIAGCNGNEHSEGRGTLKHNLRKNLWEHIWNTTDHRDLMESTVLPYNLDADGHTVEDVYFSLHGAARSEKEYRLMPEIGTSIDRRAPQNVGKQFPKKPSLACCVSPRM